MTHRTPRPVFSPGRLHHLHAFLVLALALVLPVTPASAGSEYSEPSFDPEHAGMGAMPDERIDMFTGALMLVEKDVVLPGPNGFDLEIVRWYSSKVVRWDAECLEIQSPEVGPLGIGWRIHMGRLWDNPDTTDPVPAYRLELPGGFRQPFYTNDVLGVPRADYVSPGGWSLRTGDCVGASGFCWIATSPAGIEYHFPQSSSYRMDPDNAYLYVATILDPVGNRITVDYDFGCECNQAYITRVTDAWGRIVEFHYTGDPGQERHCTLDGAPCQVDADCPKRCSGNDDRTCASDSECPAGTCSDDGSPCHHDGDCDRNCSNDPQRSCTTDQDCGTGHCVGGPDDGAPCSTDSDCGNTCLGGEHPGDSCRTDADCGATCQGGEYPGDPCTTDSQCGATCRGGRYPGEHCTTDASCGSLCEGGDQPGRDCMNDSDCGAACDGGTDPGRSCTTDAQCGSACEGGPDAGLSCSADNQCRNTCSNDGTKTCVADYECPGGTCVISHCVSGTCVHGTCNRGTCEQGTCVEGTCDIGTCPPGPTCDPQPTCEDAGECLENACEPGSPGQRYLTSITLDWLGGTATWTYSVDDSSWVDPVLASVTNPAGLRTTYDYAPANGEPARYLELKQMVLPTGGAVSYTYADHQFYYPLQNTGRDTECTRVVVSKKVGSGTWSFEWPSGRPDDRTSVATDPAGNRREYTHFRYSDDGDDRIWKAGLLERYRVVDADGTVLVEENRTWEPRQISWDDVSQKSGYSERAQAADLVERRTTVRGEKTSRVTWGGYDAYGNPAFMEERDWEDRLYRRTEYEYAHVSATFEDAHIVDRRTRVRVLDPDGDRVTETVTGWDDSNGGGNAFGNVDHVDTWTGSDWVRRSFEYDDRGDPVREVLSGGGMSRTREKSWQRGTLKKVVLEGRTIFDRTIDDASSLITAQVDGNGNRTSFDYDAWGRLVSIDPPGDDPTTTITWGQRTVTVTRGPAETRYTWDAWGRLIEKRAKVDGSTWRYDVMEYDDCGELLRQYEPSFSAEPPAWTTYRRDALGRVTSAEGPDGTVTWTYGADRVTIQDGLGSRIVVHDALGRTVEVREGAFTTHYEYDRADRLVRVDGPGSASDRRFEWNAAGWLLAETHPETGRTEYGYDGIGDLAWKQDADGHREEYARDAEGRITRIDRPGEEDDVEYYYDGDPVPGHPASYENASGQVTGMKDATGTTAWTRRDAEGRLLEVEHRRGGETWRTELEYDAAGNLSRLLYPHRDGEAATEVTWERNAAGLATSLRADGEPLVDEITWNPLLAVARLEYANGVTVEIESSEGERNRPTRIRTIGAIREGGDGDVDLRFDYNARGQVAEIEFNGRRDTYTYEGDRGFLLSVSYGGKRIDYSYDADGNLESRASSAFPGLGFSRSHVDNRIHGCSYSASGDLLSCEGHEYEYTTAHRVRTADGKVRYAYDGKGRLAETRLLASGRRLLDFRVEPLGLLSRFSAGDGEDPEREEDLVTVGGHLVATVRHGAGEPVGASLRLRRDGDDVVLTWQAPDACDHRYRVRRAADPDLSSEETLDDDVDGTAWTDTGAAAGDEAWFYLVDSARHRRIRWYVQDHRGSTLLVLDDQGEVLGEYEYFPFGGLKEATGCRDLEGTWQDARRDRDVDLFDLGSRWYSPDLARFLVPDAVRPDLRLPHRWNLYLYAANDPATMIDAGGNAARTPHGGINHLRNIDVYDNPRGFWQTTIDVAVNAAGNTLSDLLGLDTIADGIMVATDSSNSPTTRIVAAGKVVGTAALDVTISVVGRRAAARVFKGLSSRLLRLLPGRSAAVAGKWSVAAAREVGAAGEAAVRAVYDIGEKRAIRIAGRLRVPDGINRRLRTLSEIKNVRYQGLTSQIRDYLAFAEQKGYQFHLYCRPDTVLSRPLLEKEAEGLLRIIRHPMPH